MLSLRTDPFPFEAVGDLLGIMRALYVVLRTQGNAEALSRLQAAASQLLSARELARKCEPGTTGHAGAWKKADEATRVVGELVDATVPAAALVRAAGERIRTRARRR
jgi:hypothetical protein